MNAELARRREELAGALEAGAGRYQDALASLRRFGPVEFVQTGGMCAALEIMLERGYLLVTDVEDSLPWNRSELAGWGVGFYATRDACDGPEAFVCGYDTSLLALERMVEECLKEAVVLMRVSRPLR